MTPDPAQPQADTPLGARAFAARLAPLGPFERTPVLAVGVSGGADSLALCLLADQWARRRGGHIVGLTVDHGLRPESPAEARQVARWLTARGISHRRLTWRGAKPRTGLPAAARSARYDLLSDWCRRNAVLHLLLGHHLEDQAETLLLRLSRGSGLNGLAAMAPVSERCGVRLVRPLLDVPKAQLVAVLERAGQAWVEDPTNRDETYARVRWRALAPALAAEGLTPWQLAGTAARLGRARATLETATAERLAAAVTLHPAGYALADTGLLTAPPDELAFRALGQVIACLSGAARPPRAERLERLLAALRGGLGSRGRTLGGCRVTLHRGRLVVSREAAAIGADLVLGPGHEGRWDDRFAIRLGPPPRDSDRHRYRVAALGTSGWAQVTAADRTLRKTPVPPAARAVLPALWGVEGVIAVPHLSYERRDDPALAVRFLPRRPLVAGPVATAAI